MQAYEDQQDWIHVNDDDIDDNTDDEWIQTDEINIRPVRRREDSDKYYVTVECLTCETIDDAFYLSTGVIKEEVEQPVVDRTLEYSRQTGSAIAQTCSVACDVGRFVGYSVSKAFSVVNWALATPTESI